MSFSISVVVGIAPLDLYHSSESAEAAHQTLDLVHVRYLDREGYAGCIVVVAPAVDSGDMDVHILAYL